MHAGDYRAFLQRTTNTVMAQPTQPRPAQQETGVTPSGSKSPGTRLALIVLFILVLSGGFSIMRRVSEHRALAKETETLALPTVSVVRPATGPSSEELTLPAQLQAYVESSIYSRTNGYLLRWYKDIGSRVKKGELLAEIDTPEIDYAALSAHQDRGFREVYASAHPRALATS